jgi:hypothetical protein
MKGKIKGEGGGKDRGMEIKMEIEPEGFGGDMKWGEDNWLEEQRR